MPANLAQNALLSSAHLGPGSFPVGWHPSWYTSLQAGLHVTVLNFLSKEREREAQLPLEKRESHWQKARAEFQMMQRQTKKETRKRVKPGKGSDRFCMKMTPCLSFDIY